MSITIRNRWTGDVIRTIEAHTLVSADLTGADLTGADLTGAVLTGADLTGIEIPVLPNIDAAILAAINDGGTLDMDDWHRCKTTHCRAGWAIHLAGDAGKALEDRFGPSAAGALIYTFSDPGCRVPDFHCSNDDALADLQARAAATARIPRPAQEGSAAR